MRYQHLIWAGIGILILAGLIVFALLSNRLQTQSGVSMNTLQPTQHSDPDDAEAVNEAEGEAGVADEVATESDEESLQVEPTPTSRSRVPQSITLEPINTPIDSP